MQSHLADRPRGGPVSAPASRGQGRMAARPAVGRRRAAPVASRSGLTSGIIRENMFRGLALTLVLISVGINLPTRMG